MELAVDIREPLQFVLAQLGACNEALEWARGKPMDRATWDAATREWRVWLANALGTSARFDSVKKAIESRDGYGDGDGDGYIDGSGCGYIDGSGYGDGDGDGYGYGDGCGCGYGDGEPSGN